MSPKQAQEARRYAEMLHLLPPEKRMEAAQRLARLHGMEDPSVEAARARFLPFVHRQWPDFIQGRHHKIMADVFERVENGECKRVIINLPPRSTKSRLTSVLFPSWYLGKHPGHKVMICSHTASLSMDFGRDLRNTIASAEYASVFPGVSVAKDAKAAYRWNTNRGGQVFAVGKTGAAAGRGGDLVIIDDAHSEQDVLANSKEEFTKTWNWYLAGPRQRLQPGAAILICMTRWGAMDLTGQLRRREIEDEDGEEWELIQLPAIMANGESLFPEFWPIEELQKTKSTMPVSRWMANYQQTPTSEEAAIIRREWWKDWTEHDPPPCDYRVMSVDPAMSTKEGSSRSAIVVFGKFEYWNKSADPPQLVKGIILLDAWAKRVDFPGLKAKTREIYEHWQSNFGLEALIIEKKASGGPLIEELLRSGIPAQEMNPSRSKDKITRTNSIADLFASGMVYAPLRCRWVQEVVEEMAGFPNAEYNDLHDSAVWALMWIRRQNLIRLDTDPEDEPYEPGPAREFY
jgi:predicted phage terminase large subunit-like protein